MPVKPLSARKIQAGASSGNLQKGTVTWGVRRSRGRNGTEPAAGTACLNGDYGPLSAYREQGDFGNHLPPSVPESLEIRLKKGSFNQRLVTECVLPGQKGVTGGINVREALRKEDPPVSRRVRK